MHRLIIINAQRCFQKLTKGRITLFEAAGSQTSRRTNFSKNSKPGGSRASHLPHRRAEPAWSRPPAPGSRSTSRSGSAPRSGSCCSTCARPPPHTCLASPGAGLVIPEVRGGERETRQCLEEEEVVQPYRMLDLPIAGLNPRNAKKQSVL